MLKLKGGGKATIKKQATKLTEKQQLANLIQKFKPQHAPSDFQEAFANMLKAINEADKLYTSLKNNDKYLMSKLDKLELDDLRSLVEICGNTAGEGGSDRKLPLIIQKVCPEIIELASHHSIMIEAADCIQAMATEQFISNFHKMRSDQA